MRQSKEKVHNLQIRNWTISWVFYTKSNVCANEVMCVKVSQTGLKQEYEQHANELHRLVSRSIRRLEKLAPEARKEIKAFRARAKFLLETNLKTLAEIPDYQSKC